MEGIQLHVDEVHAHDIGEDHDRILRALVFGVGEVGSDCSYQHQFNHKPLEMKLIPSPMFFTSPFAVPSCLTPTVQHLPIGFEAIVFEVLERARKETSRVNAQRND